MYYFFFNITATPQFYTYGPNRSRHAALPSCPRPARSPRALPRGARLAVEQAETLGGLGVGRLPQGREAGTAACELVHAPLRRPRRAEAAGVLVMVRVLVTGANGFAGTAICRHLMERGWAVRGAVRRAEAGGIGRAHV